MDIYEFYEECSGKFGFGDGDMIPRGAYEVRDRIVEGINSKLKERNITSPIAYAFNRPGLHNSVMILWKESEDSDPCASEPDFIGEILEELTKDFLLSMTFAVEVTERKDWEISNA